MSFLDRIAECRRWDPSGFRPFLVDEVQVGRVPADFLPRLGAFPDVFEVNRNGAAVRLSSRLATVEARSRAVDEAMSRLAERGEVRPPRGEAYGISEAWHVPSRLTLDRGYVPLFGAKSYGVHVNGIVRSRDGLKLWIGKRAANKRVAPGKLDHLVAGGLGAGFSVWETLIKEADEEAAIPEDLARTARPVGALIYRCELEGGLRDDTLFLFDLELPESFTPLNTDGEIQSFELWSVEAVFARVRDSDDFKFNVATAHIDFFLRHGILDPDREPAYCDIVAGLHGQPEAFA